jgi:hypothetical protein
MYPGTHASKEAGSLESFSTISPCCSGRNFRESHPEGSTEIENIYVTHTASLSTPSKTQRRSGTLLIDISKALALYFLS